MLNDHQCQGVNCRTCRRRAQRVPLVRDCWYDIPYVWLEVVLRMISLLAILTFLFVIIHFTVGQLSALKSFSTFLEHSHLITDASELGILGKPTKEEGLYSSQDEKDESDLKEIQTPRARNTTKLWDLPVEIYKGTDDENAYFITFREICDDKALKEEQTSDESAQKGTAAAKPSHNLLSDYSKSQPIQNLQGFYGQNYQEDPRRFADRNMALSNEKTAPSQSNSASDFGRLVNHQNGDPKLGGGTVDIRKTIPESSPNKMPAGVEVGKTPIAQGDPSKLQLPNSELTKFENFVRMRENNGNINQQGAQRLEVMESKNQEGQSMNDGQYSAKPIPKLKLVLNEPPQSILEMKIDLNSIKANELTPMKGNERANRVDKFNDGEPDGISVEEEDLEAANAAEAKKYLKDKIARQIQKKENEIIERIENKPRTKGVMEVESDATDLGNISISGSIPGRRVRGAELDRSITYTEHERTMKQEVEVTYRRAQDIAKAILKTSEAIANSLDLCRKPISTNFISDEPLTEAEDVIDQIVGQLKESLELTMGCRTCVKPHKDLMLFLRWLIYDDVSVKLCPSKPKAADLRKNYLLFNHDNMFMGRVCGQGEYPHAPLNCSATGEVNGEGQDETKPDDTGKNTGARKGVVSKKRLRTNNNNG